MSSAKVAETCTILLDIGKGMLSRLSLLASNLSSPGGRPYSLQNPDWKNIRKTLEKNFPALEMNVINREAGFDAFQSAAGRIIDELEPIYLTFLDVQEFSGKCLDFVRSVPTLISPLNLTQTPIITRDFLELFTLYTQLHLYWSQLSERKVLLALYSLAHTCVHGSTENSFSSISQYVELYTEPLKRVVEDFKSESFCKILGDILVQFTTIITLGQDCDSCRQKNILSCLEEGDGMPLPIITPIFGLSNENLSDPPLLHPELCFIEKYTTWVIYSCLVCPTVLYREDVMPVFKLSAGDCLVVPIHRDSVLNVHTESELLASWFPSRSWTGEQPPKTFKLKQLFKDVAKDATIQCGLKHRERRSYLRGEMATLIQLFTQLPGLLAPKFPMVLTALAMCKCEIMWHFRHCGNGTVASRKKNYTASDFVDPFQAVLIGMHDELLQLVYANGDIIQSYYTEYLKGAHLVVIRESITELEGRMAQWDFSMGLQVIIRHIIPALEDLGTSREPESLDGFRLDWYRATAVLSQAGGTSLKLPAVKNLIARMIRVVEHSRYVDALHQTVESRNELHELWWFRDEYQKEFTACLNSPTSSCYAVSFVRSMCVMAESNCHPFCPEEQMIIGSTAASMADKMLQELADRVEYLIEPMMAEISKLDDQVSVKEAARRVERQQKRKQGGQSNIEKTPGLESALSNAGRKEIDALVNLEVNATRLLWGVNRSDEITIFDRVLRPREYVRSQLVAYFVRFSQSMFDSGNGSGNNSMSILTPSLATKRLQSCASVMQKCAGHIEIDFPALLREALFEQSCEPKVYDVSVMVKGFAGMGSMGERNIHKVINAYLNLLENAVSTGCVYSPSSASFVATRTGRGGNPSLATFATPSEMKAFALIFGTQGARALEAALLSFVAKETTKVKAFLIQNEGALKQFEGCYLGGNWDAVVSSINAKGSADFTNASINIGNALSLRSMLHVATGATQRATVPLVHSALSLASSSIAHSAEGGGNTPDLISLCKSSGINVGNLDPSLNASLEHFHTNSSNKCWELLPFAYAACLSCGGNWSSCKYDTAIDVHSGGEHLLPICASALTCAMLSPKDGKIGCENYVKASCAVLYKMKEEEETKYKDYPIRAMFVLMEKFIEVCPVVSRGFLEEHMPYSILHAAYVDMSLRKMKVGDVAMEAGKAFAAKAVISE